MTAGAQPLACLARGAAYLRVASEHLQLLSHGAAYQAVAPDLATMTNLRSSRICAISAIVRRRSRSAVCSSAQRTAAPGQNPEVLVGLEQLRSVAAAKIDDDQLAVLSDPP